MAHQLDMSNDRANMAFTGERTKIWHGLGFQMEDDMPLDEWKIQAGLNWEVKESEVAFNNGEIYVPYSDKKVLYRSDTKEALSVVGKDFKIVQPAEVLEFFRDLVENNDMKLSTAGSLFGGKRFWALAELGKETKVIGDDTIHGNLLLTTALDGTLATTAKFVSTRTVCSNTLTIALNEANRTLVKTSHRSQWDPTQVKIDLGLLDQSWSNFITNIKKMASTKISKSDARQFYQEMVFDKKKEEASRAEIRKVDKLVNLYENGIGAEYAPSTMWNLLNSITEMYTHGSGKRDSSHQFWSSTYGMEDQIKSDAYNKVLELI
jgi:phage/plasmid-like protein (TIGR03299 family)